MTRNLLFLLLLALLVQGCSIRGPIKEGYSLKNKKVAVVSELGNNFHHNIVGTTVFTNNITVADVKNWEINNLALSHALQYLNNHNVSAEAVKSNFFTPIDGSNAYKINSIGEMIIDKVKPMGYNSVLMIRPASSSNYPFHYPGYGLTTRYYFGKPSTCVYAMFIVELYDLDTNQSMGWDWANALNGPCDQRSSNDIEIKESFNAYSSQQKEEIRRRTEKRVIKSLEVSLKSLKIFH